MKICPNCKNDTRNSDIFCRYCGIKIEKNSYYILINIFIVLAIVGIVFMIALFIASFIIK